MKVYITSTPDFEVSKLKEVVDTLNLTDGILEFIQTTPLTSKQLGLIDKSYKSISGDEILSFNQLFDICEWNRDNLNIEDDSFMVMITNMNIADEWFSAFRGKNIFVDGKNWNHFTDKDSKYGISHQIIENIFQSLISLKIDGELDELIHIKPKGCINDFCDDKEDITLKFMTAHICPKCMERANEMIDNQLIIIHIKNSLRTLRDVFNNESENVEQNLPPVIISEQGKVLIGNLDLELKDVHQALYIFFLNKKDGIEKNKVHESVEIIYKIYEYVKGKSALMTPIANVFGFKIRNKKFVERNWTLDQLSSNRSKIKKVIEEKLGVSFVKYYNIDIVKTGEAELFKINLSKDKIIDKTNLNDIVEN